MCERLTRLFLSEHEFAAAQNAIVCGDIRLLRVGKSLFLDRTERDLQRVHDPMRDVVLNFEDISQIVVVAVRPNVPASSSVGKLRADPHALASTADGTFEHRALRPAGDLPG